MSNDIPVRHVTIDGKEISYDLDDPQLPPQIEEGAFQSGGYPYAKRLKKKKYEAQLYALQLELVKVQAWMKETGERAVLVFEGRDAAGKGGTINRFRQFLNPRNARTVALSKPSDTELGQWYFQRYIEHLPTDGEMVMFDRSWYNRAGVEPVMGFCTPEQTDKFLEEAPLFEKMLVNEGIHFFKFWLNVGQLEQVKRFHQRRQDPLRSWKLSSIDIKALQKWDDYTKARDRMMKETHQSYAPWTIVRSNDKRRARINAIRYFLSNLEYPGKDLERIGELDPKIVGVGPGFFNREGA